MSQADELLATLSVDYTDEARIYVNDDRTITVPDELKHIAVQGDHNIETVTFDCPRYWDEHDFSQMKVYITYMRVDGFIDSYRTKNLRISEEDDTRILFDWTISGNVTKVPGNLSFLVYIESTSANPCWHSRLNQQMIVDEGLSATEQILRAPDSIEAVLAQTTADYIAAAKAEIEGKTALSLESIPEDYTTVNNMTEEALREKSNAVKMEAEGETITVNDSADNALLGLKIYGKTTQITTTGKNLVRNELYTMTTNGLTITVHADKSFTVNGTATVGTFLTIHTDFNPGAGEYILTGCPSSGGVSKYILYMTDSASGFYAQDAGAGSTFTHPGNIAPDLRLAIYEGVRVNNATFKPMIRSASIIDDTYEPYSGTVASPSPQWPQALNNVEDVTVEIFGKNYANVPENYTYTQFGQKSVHIPAGKYVFSFDSETHGGENAPSVRFLKNDVWRWFSDDMKNTTLVLYKDETDLYFYSNGTAYDGSSGISATINGFMVSRDGGAYEAYKPVQTLDVTHTLPGIPVTSGGNYTDSDGQQWICDEIDFERGVYIQRIGRITVDDSLTYFYNTDNHFLHTGSDLFDNVAAWETRILSTHFMPVGNGIDMYDYGWFQFNGNGGIRFRIEGVDTVAALTAWLMDNVPEVMYPLVTPIETPLTDAELASFKMVRSHYPNTTVLNDSGAHMAIKYAADTKTYVDNSRSNGTLVDTATGKLYRLMVTNGQLTVVAV